LRAPTRARRIINTVKNLSKETVYLGGIEKRTGT